MTEAAKIQDPNGNKIKWSDVTENDTPVSKYIPSGDYSISVEGNFAGSLNVTIQYGTQLGQEHDIEGSVSNVFTENKTVISTFGSGYILPTISGGASSSVNITVSKILNT